ncbi:hypothetical protein C8J57DRAFT_1648962 [Mycena rebaudengoi]|nr:hypothetical protein C8J57DRAFT_1648962 [Mycena rebaudengoi]
MTYVVGTFGINQSTRKIGATASLKRIARCSLAQSGSPSQTLMEGWVESSGSGWSIGRSLAWTGAWDIRSTCPQEDSILRLTQLLRTEVDLKLVALRLVINKGLAIFEIHPLRTEFRRMPGTLQGQTSKLDFVTNQNLAITTGAYLKSAEVRPQLKERDVSTELCEDPRGMNVDNAPAAGTLMRAHTPGGISNLRAVVLDPSLGSTHLEQPTLRVPSSKSCPILTIPNEIMSEIFISFLPAYPERPPITGLLSPALLGQICRIWREVAFNTPTLWRAIEIYLHNGSSSDAQLNVLTTWLSRSRNCPLSVSFETDHNFTSPHFTAALLSHSERWEHITLIIPFDLRWLEGLDRPFPLLRNLTFGPKHYSVNEGAITVFRDASQLRTVVLGVMFNASRVVLPWSQLTSIAAVKIEPAMVANILRQATALVHLNCTVWDDDIVPDPVPPLTRLKVLILRDEDNDLGPQKLLLDSLTAPALEHLTISEHELGHKSISTIAAFLSRSHCSLQSLHATEAMLPKTLYRVAFPSIPNIVVERVDEEGAFWDA